MSNKNALFISIEKLINHKFDEILKSVNIRRDNLLSELDSFRLTYESKLEANFKTFDELENMRSQLLEMSVRQNQAVQIHESALHQITNERDTLKKSIDAAEFQLQLECNIQPLLDMISFIGKLTPYEHSPPNELALPPIPPRSNSPRPRSSSICPTETRSCLQSPSFSTRSLSLQYTRTKTSLLAQHSEDSPYYSPPVPMKRRSYFNDKRTPKYSVGRLDRGVGRIDKPLGLAYNPKGEKVYVVDHGLHKVLVFSSEGACETEFGHEILHAPHSIAIKDNYCCVTDEELNGVVKFKLSRYSVMKIGVFRKGGDFGQLNGPRGVDIDDKHFVYIADSINNRICVLNDDLDFIKVFLGNFFQLPQDIKFIDGLIYVLDRNTKFCLHSFTKVGTPIQSVFTPGKDLFFPSFFSTDFAGHLFVTDAETKGVQVFSLDGEFISCVGDQTFVWDSTTSGATGVCVTKNGHVVCAYIEGNSSLCFY